MRIIFPIILILLTAAMGGFAQQKMVPFDSAGEIMNLEENMAERLGMFTGYDNFQKARLYQQNDSLFIIEIFYVRNQDILRDQKEIALAERLQMQNRIDSLIFEKKFFIKRNDEGRAGLLTSSAILGLGFYGWAFPVILGVGSPDAALVMYTLSSAAAFGITYLTTKDCCITPGMSTLYGTGGVLGIGHGIGLSFILYNEDIDFEQVRGMIAVSTVASIGESIAGYQIAKNHKLSDGTASMISLGGVTGTLYGLGINSIMDGDNEHARMGTLMLFGSAAGYAAGYLLAKDQKYTAGDAMYVSTAALTGAYSGLLISHMGNWDSQGTSGSMILGSAAGIAAGHFLTEGYDFNKTQGLVNFLTTGFGALVGAGFGQSVVKGDGKQEWTLGLSIIGAFAGYTVGYLGFRSSALENADQVSIDLHANPAALAWQPDPANPRSMEALKLSIGF
jgi:hypothetical protein